MKQPEQVLGTVRVRTHAKIDSPRGLSVSPVHLGMRKPDAVGVTMGYVAGYGADVYWVAHAGDTAMAVYSFTEFELEPASAPCPDCNGIGIDLIRSRQDTRFVPCELCHGVAEHRAKGPEDHMREIDEAVS